MTEKLQRRLAGLRHCNTHYEVILRRGDERALLFYAPRGGYRDILTGILKRAQEFIAFTGSDQVDRAGSGEKPVMFRTPTGWEMVVTGRTERDACLEGELHYFAEAEPSTSRAQ
jgi:hypothetical protein